MTNHVARYPAYAPSPLIDAAVMALNPTGLPIEVSVGTDRGVRMIGADVGNFETKQSTCA